MTITMQLLSVGYFTFYLCDKVEVPSAIRHSMEIPQVSYLSDITQVEEQKLLQMKTYYIKIV